MTDKTLTISRLAVRIGYSLFLVGMAVATFVEWRMGSDFTHRYFYGSVWFAVAIGLLTLGALPIVITALRKRKAALLLHLAFALIVVGALTTRLFGVQGQMHLRVGSEPTAFFVDSENQRHTLPFALELRRFEVVNYPATDTPLDYRSVIADAKGVEYQVSMNRVLSIDGFRFYQSGYDPDERGTFLSVNHDPFGIGISNARYA